MQNLGDNLPGEAGQDRGEILDPHSFDPSTRPLEGGAALPRPDDTSMPDG